MDRDGLCRSVFLADLGAPQLEQILGAADRVTQGAIGVVEQGSVGQAPFLLLVLCGARRSDRDGACG